MHEDVAQDSVYYVRGRQIVYSLEMMGEASLLSSIRPKAQTQLAYLA